MKIGFVTDMHLHSDDKTGELPAYQQRVLDEIVREATDRQLGLVLLGGDDYRHTVPHWSTLTERNANVDFRLALAEICPVVAVSGNHDQKGDHYLLGDRLSSCYPILHIEAPRPLTGVETRSGERVTVVCLPWIRAEWAPDGEDYVEWARALAYATAEYEDDSDARRILLGHCAISGALLRPGQPPMKTAEPVLDPRVLLPYARFNAAFFGHYHHPQEILDDDGSILGVYGGSLFVRDFGEPFQKSWVVWDSDTGVYERVPVDCNRKIEITLDPETMEVVDARPPGTGRIPLAELDGAALEGADVRLVVQCPTEEYEVPAAVEEIRGAIEGIAASLDYRAPRPRRMRQRDGAAEVAAAQTDEDKVAALWASMDPAPEPEVAARALGLLPGVRTEMEVSA